MKILIDNGHGRNTPGKRSPDGRLREWEWTRTVASLIVKLLRRSGHDAELLVPEEHDVSLRERVARANRYSEALLVSVHVNASGMGDAWRLPHGWSVHVSRNAGLGSRRLASLLAQSAKGHGMSVRTPMPGCDYWTQNLAICRDTKCTAVLTENLFMDNRHDCELLMQPSTQMALATAHVEAIEKFLMPCSR